MFFVLVPLVWCSLSGDLVTSLSIVLTPEKEEFLVCVDFCDGLNDFGPFLSLFVILNLRKLGITMVLLLLLLSVC